MAATEWARHLARATVVLPVELPLIGNESYENDVHQSFTIFFRCRTIAKKINAAFRCGAPAQKFPGESSGNIVIHSRVILLLKFFSLAYLPF